MWSLICVASSSECDFCGSGSSGDPGGAEDKEAFAGEKCTAWYNSSIYDLRVHRLVVYAFCQYTPTIYVLNLCSTALY
jgi:hypothetical protein